MANILRMCTPNILTSERLEVALSFTQLLIPVSIRVPTGVYIDRRLYLAQSSKEQGMVHILLDGRHKLAAVLCPSCVKLDFLPIFYDAS